MVEATSDKAIAKDDIIPPKKIGDEIFDEYVLFIASWNWTDSCPSIGKLVTRCQVALEALEAARS